MRILITDDDRVCCQILEMHLGLLGECDLVGTGNEAVAAVEEAYRQGRPYGLLFLDILMPEGDGQQVLLQIRDLEERRGIRGLKGMKVVMTTSVDDRKQIMEAFRGQAEAYLMKPVEIRKLRQVLKDFAILVKEV